MADYNEIEQRILDMWPKFEDGCYVQLGDKVVANSGENKGREFIVRNVYFENGHGKLRSYVSDGCYWTWKAADPYVKRPAPKVLDADGVEIHVGDTVWHEDGTMLRVDGFGGIDDGETIVNVHIIRGATPWREVRNLSLTHEQPDSWERLEEDVEKTTCEYFGFRDKECSECPGFKGGVKGCSVIKMRDLIRRAKAIAEKEAGR